MKYKRPPDFTVLICVLILLCFGIVMVFSSSSAWAYYVYKDSMYFLKKQLLWSLFGIIALVYFLNFDYRRIKKIAFPLLIISYVLLVLVLVPGIGVKINDARRWIGVGFFSVQPSEVSKLALIIYFSYFLEKRIDSIDNFFKGILPVLLIMASTCALVLIEPHLSATVVIAILTLMLLFVAGMRFTHILVLIAGGAVLAVKLALGKEYRVRRLTSFLNPWEDIRGKGYHIIQSLFALSSGGLLGVGLGHSKQKFFYLPEPQTDFIFAIIGEELGFIGAVFVIVVFAILIWRGFKIAINSPDAFGKFLATGITCQIAIQFLIHVAVVTASLPVTGMPLPFISYGGSSLVMTLAEAGILLNISRFTEA
ncbi:MAG: stage V sporulation protein E [Thermovenabulum sp.]|uniref:stage V sporulation protein E n=1 Tax=Thermovenabulum sp. TaxID=3100335 RepID=UPI003C79AE1C